MDRAGDMGVPSANNSSDFVRKLYKMLEDPTHDAIVRWGENGESFVVLENEIFTKTILPKHFKHSNFASFVRQLNKYDFHKVRQNNEDNTPSPYGPGVWEFRHPEFQANKKDSLDNIRRKAPAPRKPVQSAEDPYPAQQIDLLNSQLIGTQRQLEHLADKYTDLANGHVVLLQQVVNLQKFVKNHDGVMHRVMGFLHTVDAQQRNSRTGGGSFSGTPGNGPGDTVSNEAADDHPASPLQQASELLEEFSASAENLPAKELEQWSHEYQMRNDYSTPPNEAITSVNVPPSTETSTPHIGFQFGNDLDHMVYPVGHTNGIDPINIEHINNIPYALPPGGMIQGDGAPNMLPESRSGTSRKKSKVESVWGPQKPRILLVEDDGVCARIGTKFLNAFECGVDVAVDGLEAVTKSNDVGNHWDLILMDIIMPNLDGVSATVCIREVRPTIPIIAMTSNIRADDIDMYFRYGMNDVLPKPFTKEGMIKALVKHLPQFTTQILNPNAMAHAGGFATPNQAQPPLGLNIGQMSAAQSLKDESSPGKSPATATSWHSPNQIPSQSPLGNGPANFIQQPMRDNGQYTMTPIHAPNGFPIQTPPIGAPRQHRRGPSDMTGPPQHDERSEKRQRTAMFAPGPGNFPQ